MSWRVKLIIRRMGRACTSCKQEVEFTSISARSAEEAVEKAKRQSGADPDYHAFGVALVKENK